MAFLFSFKRIAVKNAATKVLKSLPKFSQTQESYRGLGLHVIVVTLKS